MESTQLSNTATRRSGRSLGDEKDVTKWGRPFMQHEGQPEAASCKVRQLCASRKTGKSKHTQTLPRGTTIIHLLEKAGDVVFAAGGPGERVGVGRYMSRHQLGRLVALGTAGIPDPVVVHPKAETHKH